MSTKGVSHFSLKGHNTTKMLRMLLLLISCSCNFVVVVVKGRTLPRSHKSEHERE